MIRFLLRLVLYFAAAAIGLVVASLFLDDLTINAGGFITAVLIFGVCQALLGSFFDKQARGSALSGGVGLLTTFLSLLITDLASDGLEIEGATAWILSTLIVWVAVLLATFILGLIFARRLVKEIRD